MSKKILSYAFLAFMCFFESPSYAAAKEKLKMDQHSEKFTPLYLYQNMEEQENVPLVVEGTIPDWVEGDFVRNGPALVKSPQGSVTSWFDGLAKLHTFKIRKGTVNYTCKFLCSEAYRKFKETCTFDFAGFAQKATSSSFSLIDFLFGLKNEEITNANVTLAEINSKRVAFTEVPLPVEFDKNLNTIGLFDYADDLPKNYSFESAHLLKDPDTGITWNFLIKIGLFETAYQIYRIPPHSQERQLVASIPVSSISYMHSFSLAGRYLVLVDYPLRAKKPRDMVDGFIQAFSWYGQDPSLIYVIDKATGCFFSTPVDPFFCFHHVNGFEKEGKIFVDLVAYPNPKIIDDINHYPFIEANTQLLRLEIDPLTRHAKVHRQPEKNLEFPRLNDHHIGKEYHYFYGIQTQDGGDGLMKHDMVNGKPLSWFEAGAYANEPLFVPHPQSRTEDEGVILSVINSTQKKESFLLVLDAKTFKELARVRAPHVIPFGFHGQFFKE